MSVFTVEQQKILNLATYRGIDCCSFSSPSVSAEQMGILLNALVKAKDLLVVEELPADLSSFDEDQIYVLNKALEMGFVLDPLLEESYDKYQMLEILLGMNIGIDIYEYCDIDLSAEAMQEIREHLLSGNSMSLF